jgi:hypothetical protein
MSMPESARGSLGSGATGTARVARACGGHRPGAQRASIHVTIDGMPASPVITVSREQKVKVERQLRVHGPTPRTVATAAIMAPCDPRALTAEPAP